MEDIFSTKKRLLGFLNSKGLNLLYGLTIFSNKGIIIAEEK